MADEKNAVTVDLGVLTQSCFVIMPFVGTFGTTYERVIRPAVEAAGLVCVRADELFSRPQITHDIWKQIRSCRVVLAELTGRNPNVLYELGLAHAIGKPAIIITREEQDVPFDLKALRYLYYDTNDPFWGNSLNRSITDMCRAVIDDQKFGSVFEDITISGDLTFPEAPSIPSREAQTYDVSGVWQGTAEWSHTIDHWNLRLIQNGHTLTGTLVVSFARGDEVSVVQESIVGEIQEDSVSIRGVSYSYLQQGASGGYDLDSFSGVIGDTGEDIHGEVFDEEDHSGNLTLSRAQPREES